MTSSDISPAIQSLRILHCADLHLGSPMDTHLSAEQARQRKQELLMTFADLVSYAREQGIAFFLICGDLFDSPRVPSSTVRFVLDTIRNAPAVTFFYLGGNHEAGRNLFAGLPIPGNMHLMTDCWQSFRFGRLVISGLEITEDNAGRFPGELELQEKDFNLVMLHGPLTERPEPLSISPGLLRGHFIDYLALGHIHSFQSQSLDERGTWCYCGCPEGRGFDECGTKGFVELTLTWQGESGDSSPRCAAAFVPFARRELHILPVDITGLDSVTDLQQASLQAADGIPAEDLVRFVLTGTCGPETQKDLPFLTQLLAPSFFCVEFRDESTLSLPKESYLHDISLRGEFTRQVMAADMTPEDREKVLRFGLRALRGEAIL